MNKRHWLIKERTDRNMTQQEIADALGCERSTIAKIENGNHVSWRLAQRIAHYYGINWTIFFEEECDKKYQKQ